jgi:hypothetical protein
MIRALILALALLAAPALAKPGPSNPVDEARRIALLRALHTIGIDVGAVLPIGDAIYQVEAIEIEQSHPGETSITVRTKLLTR